MTTSDRDRFGCTWSPLEVAEITEQDWALLLKIAESKRPTPGLPTRDDYRRVPVDLRHEGKRQP